MNFYRAAVISYENVVKDFATSSFCDDAYYHMGECQLKMKAPVEAKNAFETLIRKFPDSPLG